MSLDDDVKFLQISDSHLFKNSGDKLIGVDTEASLRAVVDLASEEKNVAGILATGDLSQDGSIESYQRFKEIIDPLGVPVHWIPGNHDDSRYFHQSGNFPLTGRSVIEAGDWRILLLDSVVPGNDHGHLSSAELEYIDDHACNVSYYTILTLHHQAIPCGSQWLDTMIVDNASHFLERVAANGSIRAVINGHIHQDRQQDVNGVSYISSPSTCFQFTPDTDDFSLDTRQPGYRRLILKSSGEIETEVIRLNDYDLNIDSTVGGY